MANQRKLPRRIVSMVRSVEERMHEQSEKLDHMQRVLEQVSARQRAPRDGHSRFTKHLTDTLVIVFIVFIAQFIMRIWNSASTLRAKEL